jgi:hypothetical protein
MPTATKKTHGQAQDVFKVKRKLNKPAGGHISDDDGAGPRPGVESSVPHIALLYKGKDNHLTQELSRTLLPSAARSLGIYRRK